MKGLLVMLVGNVMSLSFMQFALIGGGLFILALLVIAQRSDDNFDLRHLIANGESVSRYAFAYMLGATVLTWAFIYYAWSFRLNVTDFMCYGLMMMFPEVVRVSFGPLIARRLGIEPPPIPPPGG
jgi:hypothetical protein